MKYQINKNPVGGTPPPFPPQTALAGRFVKLLPWASVGAAAAPELYARSHGDAARESVWDFLPYGPFANPQALRAHYDRAAFGGDPQFYVAAAAADGKSPDDAAPSGIVSFLRIHPAMRTIEIGHIWHAVENQRGRANTESALLLARRAFALGYRRLEWKCDACNMRSRRAALRLGFSFEGVFRKHLVFKGKNRDTAWFSLLDEAFPRAEAAMREWLDSPPGTFSLAERNRALIAESLAAHDAILPESPESPESPEAAA